MPMRFTDLARDTRNAVLDLGGGDEIRFAFRHGLITPQFMHTLLTLDAAHMKEATPDAQVAAFAEISEHVARLVTEWDVLENDGVTMFPLEAARLQRDIPILVQIQLLARCVAELQPGESSAPGENGLAKQPPSGATSSPRARSGRSTSRTGTHS